MIKRGDVVRGWLTRPAMLGFWALAFWGTLLAVTAAVEAASEGVPSVWRRLRPAADASIWAWLNAASIVLACAAWTIGALLVLSRRWRQDE